MCNASSIEVLKGAADRRASAWFYFVNLEHLLLLHMYEMTKSRAPCCVADTFYKHFEQPSLLRHKMQLNT